jgi:aminoglycoside phosphotransferase
MSPDVMKARIAHMLREIHAASSPDGGRYLTLEQSADRVYTLALEAHDVAMLLRGAEEAQREAEREAERVRVMAACDIIDPLPWMATIGGTK